MFIYCKRFAHPAGPNDQACPYSECRVDFLLVTVKLVELFVSMIKEFSSLALVTMERVEFN